jgi:hypothetical protein
MERYDLLRINLDLVLEAQARLRIARADLRRAARDPHMMPGVKAWIEGQAGELCDFIEDREFQREFLDEMEQLQDGYLERLYARRDRERDQRTVAELARDVGDDQGEL